MNIANKVQTVLNELQSDVIGLAKIIFTPDFYMILEINEESNTITLLSIGNLGGVSTHYLSLDNDRLKFKIFPDEFDNMLEIMEQPLELQKFVESLNE